MIDAPSGAVADCQSTHARSLRPTFSGAPKRWPAAPRRTVSKPLELVVHSRSTPYRPPMSNPGTRMGGLHPDAFMRAQRMPFFSFQEATGTPVGPTWSVRNDGLETEGTSATVIGAVQSEALAADTTIADTAIASDTTRRRSTTLASLHQAPQPVKASDGVLRTIGLIGQESVAG